jgi:hypothetical protein
MPSTFGRRSPSFGIGERFKGTVTKHKRKSTSEKFEFQLFDLVSIPAPGTYETTTCFGEESPTIKQNHLTTDFRLHSPRKAYDKVYVPGARSPRQMDFVPGPGTYSFLNQSIGQEGVRFTMKYRMRNGHGKIKP